MSSVSNEISDGIFFSTVVQGRNITIQLPQQIPTARASPAHHPCSPDVSKGCHFAGHGIVPMHMSAAQTTPGLSAVPRRLLSARSAHRVSQVSHTNAYPSTEPAAPRPWLPTRLPWRYRISKMLWSLGDSNP
jgi:hypothetical protein